MTFVLAEHLGGGVGITTATRLYHSASILRRLGGRRLAGLPAYYEPKYGSVIEILHFSSEQLDSRYAARMDKLRSQISQTPVICAAERPRSRPRHSFSKPFHMGNLPVREPEFRSCLPRIGGDRAA
jgi:hypothetical protein